MNVAVHAWDFLKEVAIAFTISTVVWPQANRREVCLFQLSTDLP